MDTQLTRSLRVPLLLAAMFISSDRIEAAQPPRSGPTTTDVRIKVVLFPARAMSGSDPSQAKFTLEDVDTLALRPLASRIQKLFPLYNVCFFDTSEKNSSTSDTNSCAATDIAEATILITTELTLDPKPDDATKPRFLITMRSLDMVNRRAIATATPDPIVVDESSSESAKNLLSPLANLSQETIEPLLGTLVIDNGKLALASGYQPYVQLVPTLTKANDPSYLPLMENLLDRRGIASVQSQFDAGAVSSGSTPIDSVCGQGQRYFVYSVSSEDFALPLSMSTRVQTHASGQLYDCTNMTVTPIGIDEKRAIITSTAPLAALLTILSKAFVSRTNSWANTIQVGALVSAFVDGKPDSVAVRDSVSDQALQDLVDNLCVVLANPAVSPSPIPIPSQTTSPTPTPVFSETPTPSPTPTIKEHLPKLLNDRLAADNLNLAKAKAAHNAEKINKAQAELKKTTALISKQKQPETTTPALKALDISGFLAQTPQRLMCHGPFLDSATGPHPSPSVDPNQRWTQELH